MASQSAEIVSKNMVALESLLSESQDRLAANLQGAIDPAKFIYVALELVRGTPGLLRCVETPEGQASIVKSIWEASELGLLLTRNLGHGYLVPYRNGQLSERTKREVHECQFQIGYRGFLELVRNADSDVQTVYSRIVWPGEQLLLDEANHQLLHTPNPEGGQIQVNQQTGETSGYVGAYAKIIYKNGQQDFEWMPLHEIEKVRRSSKAKGPESPWRQWADEMVKKTPSRRLSKRLKLTPERIAGVVRDEYRELGVENARSDEHPAIQMPRRLSQAQPLTASAAPTAPPALSAPSQIESEVTVDHRVCCIPPGCPVCELPMIFHPAFVFENGAKRGQRCPDIWSCEKRKDAKHKKLEARTINAAKWHDNAMHKLNPISAASVKHEGEAQDQSPPEPPLTDAFTDRILATADAKEIDFLLLDRYIRRDNASPQDIELRIRALQDLPPGKIKEVIEKTVGMKLF